MMIDVIYQLMVCLNQSFREWNHLNFKPRNPLERPDFYNKNATLNQLQLWMALNRI
jgi:hypothetical protein